MNHFPTTLRSLACLLPLTFALGCHANHAGLDSAASARPSTSLSSPGSMKMYGAQMVLDEAVSGQPTYALPMNLPGNEVWVTPFAMSRHRSFFSDVDQFAEGGVNSNWGSISAAEQGRRWLQAHDVRWHNAVFTDRSTGEQWTLLDRRGFISRLWLELEEDSETQTVRTRHLLFAVTLDDTDQSAALDNRDASVVMLADGTGRGARIVTPVGLQFQTLVHDPANDQLLFRLTEDLDRNGEFERTDLVDTYALPLASPEATASRWHERGVQSALEAIYRGDSGIQAATSRKD